MRKATTIMLVALAGAGLVATVAMAAKGVPSTLTLNQPSGTVWSGKVGSSAAKCRGNRQVIVVWDEDHNGYDANDHQIGGTVSSGSGAWSFDDAADGAVTSPPPGDHVAAKVSTKRRPGKRPCKAATASIVIAG